MHQVLADKTKAADSCHVSLGQGARLLTVQTAQEHGVLCEWLVQIGATGSFWLKPELLDLTNSRSFTNWANCEPGKTAAEIGFCLWCPVVIHFQYKHPNSASGKDTTRCVSAVTLSNANLTNQRFCFQTLEKPALFLRFKRVT